MERDSRAPSEGSQNSGAEQRSVVRREAGERKREVALDARLDQVLFDARKAVEIDRWEPPRFSPYRRSPLAKWRAKRQQKIESPLWGSYEKGLLRALRIVQGGNSFRSYQREALRSVSLHEQWGVEGAAWLGWVRLQRMVLVHLLSFLRTHCRENEPCRLSGKEIADNLIAPILALGTKEQMMQQHLGPYMAPFLFSHIEDPSTFRNHLAIAFAMIRERFEEHQGAHLKILQEALGKQGEDVVEGVIASPSRLIREIEGMISKEWP